MRSTRKPWMPALVRAALPLLLAALPAAAMVVADGGSAEANAKLEAEAHEAGRQHKAVVALDAATSNPRRMSNGSGVYLGRSEDGTRGFVLTAAHVVAEGRSAAEPGLSRKVAIRFAADPEAKEEALVLPATRTFLHPGWEHYRHEPASNDIGDHPAREMRRHDLALLEFDATEAGQRLERQGIQPAVPYDGKGYAKPHREGQMVGYGLFGTSSSARLDRCGRRIHAGATLVTYGTWRERTGLLHVSPRPSGWKRQDDQDPLTSHSQFRLVPTAQSFVVPHALELVQARSHARQVHYAPGDSGGPLFFETKAGLRVAGIVSCSVEEVLFTYPDMEPDHFLVHVFEPVKDNLAWIRKVMAGQPGETKAEAPEGKAGAGAAGQESKEERKS